MYVVILLIYKRSICTHRHLSWPLATSITSFLNMFLFLLHCSLTSSFIISSIGRMLPSQGLNFFSLPRVIYLNSHKSAPSLCSASCVHVPDHTTWIEVATPSLHHSICYPPLFFFLIDMPIWHYTVFVEFPLQIKFCKKKSFVSLSLHLTPEPVLGTSLMVNKSFMNIWIYPQTLW